MYQCSRLWLMLERCATFMKLTQKSSSAWPTTLLPPANPSIDPFGGSILPTLPPSRSTPVSIELGYHIPNTDNCVLLSEFLLGDDLLVAPVLDEGVETRNIYLPIGSWRDEADPTHPVYQGPLWLNNYSADLWTLPYFTRVTTGAMTDEL